MRSRFEDAQRVEPDAEILRAREAAACWHVRAGTELKHELGVEDDTSKRT